MNTVLFAGAYIFVEFFFIFQGFWIYKKINFVSDPLDEAFAYVKRRVCVVFPCVLYMSILILASDIMFGNFTDCYSMIIETISKLSLLGMLVSSLTEYTGVLWFISGSIIMGGLVTYLICEFKQKLIVFIPFIVGIISNCIITQYGKVDVWWELVGYGVLPVGLFRAFSGILLGVLCGWTRSKINDPLIRKECLLLLAGLVAVICVYGTIINRNSKHDLVWVFLFSFMIVIGDLSNLTSNCKLINLVDELTMPMYLLQLPFLRAFEQRVSANYFACYVLLFDLLFSFIWVIAKRLLKHSRLRV